MRTPSPLTDRDTEECLFAFYEDLKGIKKDVYFSVFHKPSLKSSPKRKLPTYTLRGYIHLSVINFWEGASIP